MEKNTETKKENKCRKILARTQLFKDCGDEAVCQAISNADFSRFEKGEIIFDGVHNEKKLCVLLSGSAVVLNVNLEHRVLMNKLTSGGIFGVVTLFGNETFFLTEIKATSKCEVMYISEAELCRLFQLDFTVCRNYISYLTQRIRFLHGKIEAFTGTTVEKKLFSYLKNHWHEADDGFFTVTLTVSLTELAEVLSIGRASLYRVLNQAQEDGILKRRGKEIIICSSQKVLSVLQNNELNTYRE